MGRKKFKTCIPKEKKPEKEQAQESTSATGYHQMTPQGPGLFMDLLSGAGNQNVQAFFKLIQARAMDGLSLSPQQGCCNGLAKLQISQPRDFYERQADKVVEQVVNRKPGEKTPGVASQIKKVQLKGSASGTVTFIPGMPVSIEPISFVFNNSINFPVANIR